MKIVAVNYWYGFSKCPVSKSELYRMPVPPSNLKELGAFIEKVERVTSELCGFPLRVDAINADKYRIFIQGNGFDVLYESGGA